MADGKRSVIVDRKRGAVLIFVLFANPCLNGGERKADTRANGSTTRNTGKAFLPFPTGTGAMIAAQQKCAFVPWPVVLAPLTMYTSIAACGHADTRGGGMPIACTDRAPLTIQWAGATRAALSVISPPGVF